MHPNASGDIHARLFAVIADDNGNDGMEFEEFGPGSVTASLVFVQASGNDGSGFKVVEGSEDYLPEDAPIQNAGDVSVSVALSTFETNEEAGVEIEQNGPGVGLLRLFFNRFRLNHDGPTKGFGFQTIGRA